MKIKNDFVTNSSSTSFIIWGKEFETDKLMEIIGEKLYEHYVKLEGEFTTKDCFLNDSHYSRDYLLSLIRDSDLDLEASYDQWDDNWISIGKSPFRIKPCETLLDFLKDIQKSFKKLGLTITTDQIVPIMKCWRDG